VTDSTSTPAAAAASTHTQRIGQILELAGIAAFVAGMILSVHHYGIGACFAGGAAAYFVGKQLVGN
jgi:hypothetical protein